MLSYKTEKRIIRGKNRRHFSRLFNFAFTV